MPKYLVLVESPAKAKTIQKYLGKNYKVMATYGHVRDLVPKEGAVDTEHDFAMKYQPIERNAPHMEAIVKAMQSRDALFLATDPDREGEAIAWHVQQMLEAKKILDGKPTSRVVFHQITKNAVQDAIEHPREVAMDLVNAQQARRALDFLVGFTLSPLLWVKIRPGLSAGRVQSPALRMITEREEEIERFESQEYWTIHAGLLDKKQEITARLVQYRGKKFEQFTITNSEQAAEAEQEIIAAAKGEMKVAKITKRERSRKPAPPFITSTLQQEAARKLGFTTQRTMMIAQQLYEGIDVGEGAVGLITYMRTDSVTLAAEAITEIRDCIKKNFGKDKLPKEARLYKTKSKNAQEAHEAIRPTSAAALPEQIKSSLTPEQYKLYNLIWQRTVASQMIDAKFHTVSVDFAAGDHLFRVSGSTIIDPGFMALYLEGNDDAKGDDANKEKMLPEFNEGQTVAVKEIYGEQHFTEPPPRYTEASLVKSLEEHGIGRPSTYASIIATLKHREYVEMQNKQFKPTDVGRIVNRFLTQYFTQYVDYDFTARLEDQLDEVSRGDKVWVPVLKEFWAPFKELIAHTKENVKRSDVTQEQIDEVCPKCGKPLSIRLGKRGRFVGCTAYPDCDFTRNLQETSAEASVIADRKCPDCQNDLVLKFGPYGQFIGCSNYPNCRHIEPLEKPKDIEVECPLCHESNLFKRKSRYGKIFYSCGSYPKCKYAVWNEPLKQACPKCNWPIMTLKTTKRHGTEKVCPQKECGYKEPADDYVEGV
jgi:DNA topoisomerase-1